MGNQENSNHDTAQRRVDLIRRIVKERGKDYSNSELVRAIKQAGLWPSPTPEELAALRDLWAQSIVIAEIADCLKDLGTEEERPEEFSVESYARRLVDLTFGKDTGEDTVDGEDG